LPQFCEHFVKFSAVQISSAGKQTFCTKVLTLARIALVSSGISKSIIFPLLLNEPLFISDYGLRVNGYRLSAVAVMAYERLGFVDIFKAVAEQ